MPMSVSNLFEDQRIRVVSIIGAFLMLGGMLVTYTERQTNMQRDIVELNKIVEEVNGKILGSVPPTERWHKTHMRLWCAELEKLNKTLDINCPRITLDWP